MTSEKELCERLRETGVHAPPDCDRCRAAARIEAITAERDAAVERADAALAERNKAEEWLKMAKSNTADYERVVMAMGERRATAAIVADLKQLRYSEAYYRISLELDNLATRYERGDHLNPLDT